MRIVFDTNVLISAFIARGHSHRVFEHCLHNHTIVTSRFILEEFHEKLVDRFHYEAATADAVISFLESCTVVVTPEPLAAPVCRDPDDDTVIGTALSGACHYIVTGDKDLLVLKTIETVTILTPAEIAELEQVQ